MRVLEASGETDLALEAIDAQALGHFGREHLDDYSSSEGGLRGDEHARHAATAELAIYLIRAGKGGLELIAKRVGHAMKLGPEESIRDGRYG
jgi:hypothetical protein